MSIKKSILPFRLDGPLRDSIGAILDEQYDGITIICIDSAAWCFYIPTLRQIGKLTSPFLFLRLTEL